MGLSNKIAAFAFAIAFLTSAVSLADNVPWQGDLDRALQTANSTGKPVLVHFYSSNCPPCKLLDVRAFNDADLVETMRSETIPVKINVDHHREAADRYQVTRWPTDVYLFPDGSELYRTVSPQDPKVYTQMIQRASLRNRDWVLERNATFANAQRRQANSQEIAGHGVVGQGVRDQAVRTPSRDLAPGQVSPPRVQAQLANYPVPQQPTEVDPRFDTRVPTPPQPAIAQAPQGNRYQGLSGTNTAAKAASTQAPRNSTRVADAAPTDNSANLPQIVQGNRYKTYSQHFNNANKQSVGGTNVANRMPAEVPNPMVAPVYGAAIEPPAISGSPSTTVNPSDPNLGIGGIAISEPRPTFEAPIVQPTPSRAQPPMVANAQDSLTQGPVLQSPQATSMQVPASSMQNPIVPPNGLQVPAADAPSLTAPSVSAMTVASPSKATSTEPSRSASVVFDGNCPVALERTFEWKPGSPRFGVKHRGRVYYCESEESRTVFLSDPDRYSPEFSGYDVVKFLESGELVEGDRRFGCSFQDRIYLFSSNETYQRFLEARDSISAELKQVQSGAGKVATRPGADGSIKR